MSEPVKLSNDRIKELIVEHFRHPGILTTDDSREAYLWHGEVKSENDIAVLMTDKIAASQERIVGRLLIQLDDERQVYRNRLRTWVDAHESKGITDAFLRTYFDNLIVSHDHGKAYEAAILYLKQFFWAIKRRIKGFDEVLYPICPVFWSDGGAGKTYNIERIIAPIRDFSLALKMDQVVDDNFSGSMLSKKLCVFLDELQGAQPRQEGPIKAIMTAKTLDGRHMRQTNSFSQPNRLTFIAASNYEPPFNFKDPNMLRRFGPIEVNATRAFNTKQRIATRDAIDVNDLWRSISYKDPNPFESADPELRDFIEARNASYAEQQSVYVRFAEEELVESPGAQTPMHEIQEAMIAFCRRNRFEMPKPFSQDALHREFNKINVRCTSGKRKYRIPDHRLQLPHEKV